MVDFFGMSEPGEAGMGQAVWEWPAKTDSVGCMAAGQSVAVEAVTD